MRTPFFYLSLRLTLATMFFLAACRKTDLSTENKVQSLPASLIPEHGSLIGAYMDFGEKEDEVTLKKIDYFEKLAGKSPAIIASSSYWGEQTFPAENLRLIATHGAVPLVFWSPWDRPYDQNRGADRFSLTEILSGKWDAYIDSWADGAKAFGKPFFVSLCNEMNGNWFPWSGFFYGKGILFHETPDTFSGPETFKSAWRYIVDRVRARGASNIRWVLHFNNYSYPNDVWNEMKNYYPGSGYVDWLGLSVYGKQFQNEPWVDAEDLLDYPYKEICAIDSAKPIMITEFGIGEFPKSGDKALWIKEMLEDIKDHCPRVHAAVYWHERWQNDDGSFSNLRINSSAPAQNAFRVGINNPYWITSTEFSY